MPVNALVRETLLDMADGSTLIHPVPYYAQWESPALVPDIIAGTLSAADDPLWQKSGADSPDEYAFWSWRLCGMACLRMALDHWRARRRPRCRSPRSVSRPVRRCAFRTGWTG